MNYYGKRCKGPLWGQGAVAEQRSTAWSLLRYCARAVFCLLDVDKV